MLLSPPPQFMLHVSWKLVCQCHSCVPTTAPGTQWALGKCSLSLPISPLEALDPFAVFKPTLSNHLLEFNVGSEEAEEHVSSRKGISIKELKHFPCNYNAPSPFPPDRRTTQNHTPLGSAPGTPNRSRSSLDVNHSLGPVPQSIRLSSSRAYDPPFTHFLRSCLSASL